MDHPILTDKELRYLKRFIIDNQGKWNQYYSIFVIVVFIGLGLFMYSVYPPTNLSIDVMDIEYQTNLAPAEWVPKAFEKFARLTDKTIRNQIFDQLLIFALMFSCGCIGYAWREGTRNRIIAKLLCAHWDKIKPDTNSPDNPSSSKN
jgi:hypothetical protein